MNIPKMRQPDFLAGFKSRFNQNLTRQAEAENMRPSECWR